MRQRAKADTIAASAATAERPPGGLSLSSVTAYLRAEGPSPHKHKLRERCCGEAAGEGRHASAPPTEQPPGAGELGPGSVTDRLRAQRLPVLKYAPRKRYSGTVK